MQAQLVASEVIRPSLGSPMENNLKLISQVTVFTAVPEDKEML